MAKKQRCIYLMVFFLLSFFVLTQASLAYSDKAGWNNRINFTEPSFFVRLCQDIQEKVNNYLHPITPQMQEVIQKASEKHQVSRKLILEVIRKESKFDQFAVSSRGAQGLMQLMPKTARSLGIENAFNLEANIDGGTRYLKTLLQLYDNDLVLALAAYNAGPAAVKRYKGVPPYPETHAYIWQIMNNLQKN
jgi:soluble lytic murein transglycosylase-like protein